MHEEAAARIKMPALKPLRSHSTSSSETVTVKSGPSQCTVAIVTPGIKRVPQHEVPVASAVSHTHPKRSSVHYDNYQVEAEFGLRDWIEQVHSGRNDLTAMDPSVLRGWNIDEVVLQSPPSSPGSSPPTTPTSGYTLAANVLNEGGFEDDFDDVVHAYVGYEKAVDDGGVAL
jgi:hypothetical protein